MNNLSKLSKPNSTDWEHILDQSDIATIFHTREWIQLMVEFVGVKGELLIVYNNNKPIVNFNLLRQMLCLYSGP